MVFCVSRPEIPQRSDSEVENLIILVIINAEGRAFGDRAAIRSDSKRDAGPIILNIIFGPLRGSVRHRLSTFNPDAPVMTGPTRECRLVLYPTVSWDWPYA